MRLLFQPFRSRSSLRTALSARWWLLWRGQQRAFGREVLFLILRAILRSLTSSRFAFNLQNFM